MKRLAVAVGLSTIMGCSDEPFRSRERVMVSMEQPLFYTQELNKVLQDFSDGSYKLLPHGGKEIINWDTQPTINRWYHRLDDEASAPRYRLRVKDAQVHEIKWYHGAECGTLQDARNSLLVTNVSVDIPLTAARANVNLRAVVEKVQPQCLGMWLLDKSGKVVSEQNVKFSWNTKSPPLVVDFNSPLYDAEKSADDFATTARGLENAFNHPEPYYSAVAHALIHNPHDVDVMISPTLNATAHITLHERENIAHGAALSQDFWLSNGRFRNPYSGIGMANAPEPRPFNDDYIRPLPNLRFGIIFPKLANPFSEQNKYVAQDKCEAEIAPTYSKVCAPGEVAVFAAANPARNGNCIHQEIECVDSTHRYWVPFETVKNGHVSKDVGYRSREKAPEQEAQLQARYFSYDKESKQITGALSLEDGKLVVPAKNSVLIKWYLQEEGDGNQQVVNSDTCTKLSQSPEFAYVKDLLSEEKTFRSGECRAIIRANDKNQSCENGQCRVDIAFWYLDKVSVELKPKAASTTSLFKYSSAIGPQNFASQEYVAVAKPVVSREIKRWR